MNRLNSKLRDALAVVTPFSDRTGLFPAMLSGELDMRGMTRNELITCIQELENIGMLEVFEVAEDGSDFVIILTSSGASYFHDCKVEVARSVGRYLMQLLVGASGGLVVWVLGNLAS